ncbi:hypothetical protein L1987_60381 [Smallanthus sonchifolius]|uniref:Uncharacterized protein n=1 Tax=Smallanthus sonchifolius TaxID=185202 RepID=A0ACB9D7T7_9ASTR|nr:hypothetical protein L1987_60381 [Smallanthus sonchifolius]
MHRINGTTLKFSTAYHPQTDGQSEALNRCLEMYLRCYVADYPHKWLHFLPWAEFWYNTSYQTSSQMTPFEILYGRKPPTLTRYLRDSTTNTTLEEQFLERDNVLTLLKTNLLKAQSRMKLAADKHRKDVHFLIDDWVYVKLQPYRQGSVRLRRHHKLGRRYFGPYRIIAKIVNQLTPLHLVDSTSALILQPQKVLQTRTVYKGTQLVPQSLIQWEGLHVEDATWEDTIQLQQQFPNFLLEDKVNFNGGGIVIDPLGPLTSDATTNMNQGQQRKSERIKVQPKKFQDHVMGATSAQP